MAAAMNSAVAKRAIGILRQSFNLVRTLSTSVAPATSASEPEKPKRRKKKNLFEVTQFLPNWGIGYKVAKTHWSDVAYQITKINLYKDGRHGKAWGIRYKAGLQAAESPTRISGVNKRGWKYLKESQKKAKELPKLEVPSLA
ncbi:uncharacterized protein [Typha angustifolia]|uniref:uncharacterized protein n=1 Tax=Typha angustifolia TaxID=59011 RepID=UPI003C308365